MAKQTIIFFSILSVFMLWLFNRHRIRYWAALLNERGWKSSIHYDRSLTVFKNLYSDVNPMQVSIQEREKNDILGDSTFTYGEVTFYSFVRILEKAEPKEGEVFYDLGSGGGKAVMIAGIVFPFSKACGIEKLEGLYNLSTTLLHTLNSMPERKALLSHKSINIQFIQADFLEVDFSDADIIFVNATCFGGELFNSLVGKFLKLKKGTRIILGSANLAGIGGFQLKYSDFHLMSWGLNSVRIYERI